MIAAMRVLINSGWALVLFIGPPTFASADDDAPPPRVSVSRPMDPSYQVLQTRSIFSKDHNRAAVIAHPGPPTTHPAETIAVAAEASYVLRGVTVVDGRPTAFIEQTEEKKLVNVQAGDTVSRGQITAVTLDGVDFTMDGKTSHIQLGQGLSGGVTVTPPTTMPAPDDRTSWWAKKHHKE